MDEALSIMYQSAVKQEPKEVGVAHLVMQTRHSLRFRALVKVNCKARVTFSSKAHYVKLSHRKCGWQIPFRFGCMKLIWSLKVFVETSKMATEDQNDVMLLLSCAVYCVYAIFPEVLRFIYLHRPTAFAENSAFWLMFQALYFRPISMFSLWISEPLLFTLSL